jgi:hypothetical protein
MPKAFCRFLAVLLLALTVPIQGLAAVTAAQCMAFGHHEESAGHETQALANDGADGHDHSSHAHSQDSALEQGADDGNGSHCGPCAACCASASIAGPPPHSILSSPSRVTYLFSPLPPPGVEPDGLDRPPLAL